MFEIRNQYGDIGSGYVQAALKDKGWTSADLARKNGLAPSTFNTVWARKYRRVELIIAEVLDMKPEDIWPSRYIKNSTSKVV